MEKPNGTRTAASSKIAPLSFFKRSVTSNPSSASMDAAEVSSKDVYSLYNTPALQGGGSIKSFYIPPIGSMVSAGNSLRGKVKKLCSLFDSPKYPSSISLSPPPKPTKLLLTRPDPSNRIPKSIPPPLPELDPPFRLPGTEDRVVIYFTSLRGIRRTFEDCHSTRMIFQGLRVNLDERDISLDAAYRKELQKVLGEINIRLPQVFIKGKYIGGADVIRQLLEAGEIPRLVKGLPLRVLEPCDSCAGVRFVPCASCNGSQKVFDEDNDRVRRCADCNENGLARCPLCCFS